MNTTTMERQTLMHIHTIRPAERAAGAVLRPGMLGSPAALQALGLARFADDPGAQGAAPSGDGQEPAGQANEPGGEQTPAGAGNDAQDGKESDPADWQMDQLPAGAQDYIRSLRQEAKKDRVAQQESAADKARREITESIAQALGLGEADPDKVTDQLATLTQERDTALAAVKAYETQQTIRAAADIVAVDADKALDLKALDKALEDIDLTDTKAVQDALLAVADQHPHIKTASTVERTGGNHHSGEGNRPKPKTLSDAIASQYQ